MEWVGWTILKNKVFANFHQKGSTISALDWKIWTFQEKNVTKFFSLASHSFRARYLYNCSSKLSDARNIGNYTSRAFRAYKFRRKRNSERPPNNNKDRARNQKNTKKWLMRWQKWKVALVYQPPIFLTPL